jgi:hypothetical protein
VKGKTPVPGLVVVASVLLVAAGLFGTLFFLNQPDPRTGACLAAAHLLANTARHSTDDGSGMAVAAGFERVCSTETAS